MRKIAGECFEMGRHSYYIGEDEYAISWFAESLRKHEFEGQKTVQIVRIKCHSIGNHRASLVLVQGLHRPIN